MKTKHILLTALIITLVYWINPFKRFRNRNTGQNDNSGTGDHAETDSSIVTGTPPEGFTQELFISTNNGIDWENKRFTFITPLGAFTINNPDTRMRQYMSLRTSNDYQFGYQSPHFGKVVVTLLPLQQFPVVSNIIIDLEAETIEFEYVQL